MEECKYLKKDIMRFWSKVKLPEMVGTDECWEWQIGSIRGGYGLFRINTPRSQVIAHKFSYEITLGSIPKGLCVCHSCDNPKCVNPAHLWIGTHYDNARDRDQKGRGAPRDGENNPGHKLKAEEVVIIRQMYKTGLYTQKVISDLFKVSPPLISAIVNYKQWTHIP